jgi:hypothetical protein
MDFPNIETGWLHFPSGAGPDIRTVKLGQALPDRPTPQHRSGYRLLMLLGKQSGGDVREMASNAQVSIKGMDLLHDAYAAAPESKQGMLPVVKLAGTLPVTTQGKANGQPVSSTNYQPVWQIVKWVNRPPELDPEAIAKGIAAQPQPAPPPPQQALPLPPPPAPEPARQLATVEDDF